MLYFEHIAVSSQGLIFKDKMGKSLSLNQALNKAAVRFYNYFLDFELLLIRIISGVPIHTLRVNVYKLFGVKVGKGSHFHTGTQFFKPSGVIVGQGTIIGQNAFLDGRDFLKIGDYVDIASEVMIYNSEHDINSEDFKAVSQSVEIGDYVFVGPRAIILPGVKIGKGAVVAAGAVITHDVAPFSIVGGVPAKIIGERKLKDLRYKLGRPRLFQ